MFAPHVARRNSGGGILDTRGDIFAATATNTYLAGAVQNGDPDGNWPWAFSGRFQVTIAMALGRNPERPLVRGTDK